MRSLIAAARRGVRQRLAIALGALVVLAVSRGAWAFDAIVLTADSVTTPVVRADGVRVALDLTPAAAPSMRVSAAAVDLRPALGRGGDLTRYRSLDLACARIEISGERVACRGGRLSARGGVLDPLTLRADAELDTARGVFEFEASDLPIADGRAQVSGAIGAGRWSVRGHAAALDAAKLRTLVSRWVEVPAGYSSTGRIDADFNAASGARAIRVGVTASTSALGLSNAAGTLAADKLAATVTVDATLAPEAIVWQTDVVGRGGQVLIGPVLADFGANPLTLRASGLESGRALDIDSFSLTQSRLIQATGAARVALGSEAGSTPRIERAQVQVASLQFPAAYTTFLQLPLAATDFAALRTSGRASGRFEVENGAPVRLDADIERLDIADPSSRLSADDLKGSLHWVAAGESAPSFVSFKGGRAYGIEIGPTRLDFAMRGLGFRLAHQTRIPVFDGALVVHSLGGAALGRPDARLRFDATIEPIGMPQLCKAFGWPLMQGSLSGRVPGLRYRNREMTFNGDVVAQVFDGTIRGSNIRLTNPLGPWPRLHADVTARNLDLDLVTRTFPIGSITGRLDADITGLDLFNWSPVSFDAKLYTAPGDTSRHLISQKAVTSLSNVGGGGGAVAAALQSGVLRFFETFHYDRIGLKCVLRNEVCLMSGIQPAGNGGYYIVKGRGLPRIDIIGNQGRVNWPQLVSQIVSAMHGGDVVVH